MRRLPLSTGKERDAETGLDYFGARYFASSQGRMTSPDAPFADQHPADPQSWNLYAYGRNNPLRFIDPSGREAISAEQCAKNPQCMTVSVNVILDQNAKIFDKNGNLTENYQKSLDAQLDLARDEYGTIGIYLDVSVSKGAVDNKFVTEGMKEGSINVAVSDSAGAANINFKGGSRLQIEGPVVLLNMANAERNTLSHELAHHFSGDTRSRNPFGIVANAIFDVANDPVRSSFGGRPAFSEAFPRTPFHPAAAGVATEHPWRAGARSVLTPWRRK